MFRASFTMILVGKREQVASFCLSSWCLVIVMWLFFTMLQVCLQFDAVVFPDYTHLLFCLFIAALWSPAGKMLTPWFSFQ